MPDWEKITFQVLRHTTTTKTSLLAGEIVEMENWFDRNDSEGAQSYIKKVPKRVAPERPKVCGLVRIW